MRKVTSKSEIVLIEGARTAFAEFGGSFREVSAIDLGVAAAKEAMARRYGPAPAAGAGCGRWRGARDAGVLAALSAEGGPELRVTVVRCAPPPASC